MNITVNPRFAAAALATAMLAGCAAPQNPSPSDPWEGFNRGVYKFNDTVDRGLFKPVAQAYDYVMPNPVQSCVHNIFSNLGDVWGAANSMLQGRGHDAVNTFGRFLFNSTMGLGGCIDVATMNGANKIPNDFGTTLGVWGLGQGPYVVLPLLGPSTVRDSVGRVGDWAGNVVSVREIDNVRLRNSLWGLEVIDTRASLLGATDTVDRVALDPYSFVRDAYLQRRAAMVRGAKPGSDANLPDYSIDEEADAPAAAPAPAPAPAK
ncbi:lipoprotein [Bordetella ansorpii]|uniref:Lipoprotein n=1 Tax=Bordetella ansorpii TaxID=288768 RepID=A0A157NBD7_9BORD|nr:VacJ family lipoprotein [Bordetella ansorpii]SAI18652.1 lipoprotein [Bordetella ansorpii]